MGLDSSIQSLIYKRNCKQNFNVRLLVIFLINYSIFPKIAWAGEVYFFNDYCTKIFKNYHLKTFEQLIEFEKYYNLDGFVTNFKKPYPTIFFDKNFVESNEIFMNLCSFKYDLIFNFDFWDSELDSEMLKSPKFTQNIWQNKLQNLRQIMDFFWIKPITFGENINYLNSNQKKILSINELKSRLIILILQYKFIKSKFF